MHLAVSYLRIYNNYYFQHEFSVMAHFMSLYLPQHLPNLCPWETETPCHSLNIYLIYPTHTTTYSSTGIYGVTLLVQFFVYVHTHFCPVLFLFRCCFHLCFSFIITVYYVCPPSVDCFVNCCTMLFSECDTFFYNVCIFECSVMLRSH